ncbi:MAG TPA: SBBP repeat-containing protein [Bacteroidia bacterium]|nr:SBBP repeat-containing protein [Bacteroidia bacterium]
MKKNLLLLILNSAFLIFNSFGQSADWLWARSAGGSDNDYGNSVAADGNGNVYVTGFFESASITFGSTTLFNAGPSGTPDVFLAKYDSSGNIIWAKSAGGNYYDKSFSVALDGSGNIFVTGYFYSAAITFGTITLTSPGTGYSDMFVVKYNSAGNVLWAKSAGGIDSEVSFCASADSNGNVFVTGYFISPSVVFGTITLNNTGYPYSDIFIAKYDSAGNVLWAKSAGGVFPDAGYGVAADGNGNVFLTGNFTSASVTFGTTTLTATGGSNFFITKYNSAGNVLWANTSGGSSTDYGNAAATDGSGNVYVTGYYSFFPVIFGTDTLSNAGQSDLFITKYDSLGNVLWTSSAGGSNIDIGISVATDAGGNVFMTGHFFSSSIAFATTVLNNNGNNDIFLVQYDSAGNVILAQSTGGSALESGQCVATGASDNVYVTGIFNSASVTFGTTVLNNSGAGGSDIFIARIDSTILGIVEYGDENAVRIFPNPATGEIRIQDSGIKIDVVEIYDVLGDKVFKSQIRNPKSRISVDVSTLAPGIYFVKVRTGAGESVAKFVKE